MVNESKRSVVWDKQAYMSLLKNYQYIKVTSLSNADKVKKGILKTVQDLPAHPEKYPLDKFKRNNDGNYRAFEKYSLRVAYKIGLEQILILRIRHVKQEPKTY